MMLMVDMNGFADKIVKIYANDGDLGAIVREIAVDNFGVDAAVRDLLDTYQKCVDKKKKKKQIR